VVQLWSAWDPNKEGTYKIRVRSVNNVTVASNYGAVRAHVAFAFRGVTSPRWHAMDLAAGYFVDSTSSAAL